MIIEAIATFSALIYSPIGPSLALLVGSLLVLIIGRWFMRPGWLTGFALSFVLIASFLVVVLRIPEEYAIYSRPWQPLFQGGANLEWIGDGWNCYVALLILLIGGSGILLDWDNRPESDLSQERGKEVQHRQIHSMLAVHLAFLATALLFIFSSNLLTVVLTWVMMDLLMLIRSAMRPENADTSISLNVRDNRARGLSLLGALLLMVGLLPAGPSGPGQQLALGILPYETALLMLVAAAIRAGAYPFHLWLLPTENERVNLSERLLDQMVSVLCGLWLLGWTINLGGGEILQQPVVLLIIILMMLGSAIAGLTAPDQPNHTTFVLITSTTTAALSGALAFESNPSALIWPTTVFALGGGLWLIGERVSQDWDIPYPLYYGAATLAGSPLTLGFLIQPSLSQLLTADSLHLSFFGLYLVAQTIQIAALVRNTGVQQRDSTTQNPFVLARQLFACTALGTGLAFISLRPGNISAFADMTNGIPPLLGTPPILDGEVVVWITLGVPLALGIILSMISSGFLHRNAKWPDRLSQFTRLEWLFQVSWWSVNRVSDIWGNAVGVLEGAGYIGWLAVFVLFGYLLIN